MKHCSHRLLYSLLLMLLLASSMVFGGEFEIQDAVVEQRGDEFSINMQIRYHFSEVALDALENGVPLTVDLHFQVRRKGAWVWESDVADLHLRRAIRYLPLSSTYEVRYLPDGERTRFVSRTAAIDALGHVKNFPVVKVSQLQQGEQYLLQAKSELDIEALPVPLRPTAYISSAWNMSSDWSQWQIAP